MLGSPKRIDTRVTPEALQVIYMDEIAGRLADLAELYESLLKTAETEVERLAEVRSKLEEVKETLERTIPLGDTGDYKLSVTGDDTTILDLLRRPVSSFTLFNDGPGNVYVATNHGNVPNSAPIKSGEQYSLNARARVIWRISLRCDSGESATVRIKTLR